MTVRAGQCVVNVEGRRYFSVQQFKTPPQKKKSLGDFSPHPLGTSFLHVDADISCCCVPCHFARCRRASVPICPARGLLHARRVCCQCQKFWGERRVLSRHCWSWLGHVCGTELQQMVSHCPRLHAECFRLRVRVHIFFWRKFFCLILYHKCIVSWVVLLNKTIFNYKI